MAEPYRVAVYYAPGEDDPLWRAGCAWLGYDTQSGAALAQPHIAALAESTRDPRRYGFHATLKAPMALRGAFETFLADAAQFAALQKPFALPRLEVTLLHGFLALCPVEPAPELYRLAADCLKRLDAHRLPESAEVQAWRAAGRTSRQAEHIARWGYPLVLDDFRFHMTLTNTMDKNPYVAAARAHFATALARTRSVDEISIFVEYTRGAPLRLFRRLGFGA